jgi:Amt family ammonium transporter
MSNRRKWWQVLISRKPVIWFVAIVLGFVVSRSYVFSQDAKKAPDAAVPAAAAPAAATTAPAAAPAEAAAATPKLPDYFSSDLTKKDDSGLLFWPDATGGHAGVWATPAGDGKGDVPTTLSKEDNYDRISHNLFSINFVWTLVTGFLVMFMQAGFAMVEGGLCRSKNSAHTFAMNFMIYPLGCIAFYVYGFALGWGNWYNGPVPPGWYASLGPGTAVLNQGIGIGPDSSGNGAFKYGIVGTKGWCLQGVDDVGVMALFFFMMVFMDTTATIPTGAMAERWTWKNFCLYGLWVALPYCIYANWLWGGGWLAQMGVNWGFGHGAVDFAGSGVVHAMGGIIGLAGAICIGPRIGKYVDGKINAFPGHSLPMALIGTFILAFGWFGFNPGSTLAGSDLRIAHVVVNTMLASVTGALATMCYMMFVQGKKPDPSMLCNGMLAGLVAITAPSAFVNSMGACIIGAVAGVLVVWSVAFFDKVRVDDPVGAISVHGACGLWGVLSVGLLATGQYGAGWNGVVRDAWVKAPGAGGIDGVRGLFYGDPSQLVAQIIDCGVVFVFGFAMAMIWFKFSNLITPLRVSRETEIEGLDMPEMGALGWPDFEHTGSS